MGCEARGTTEQERDMIHEYMIFRRISTPGPILRLIQLRRAALRPSALRSILSSAGNHSITTRPKSSNKTTLGQNFGSSPNNHA